MKTKLGALVIEGHVQGLSNTRSLGEKGIPVYVVDKGDCIAKHSRYCTKYFKCPDYRSDEFADFLVQLAITQNIQGWVLFPSNDHAVATISKHKQRLDKYYKTNVPEIDIFNKIYDKAELLRTAERVNVPIPKTQYFSFKNENLSHEIPLPVITKGRYGLTFYKATSKKAFLANSAEELHNQLNKLSSKLNLGTTFTQELIPYDGTNKTVSFTAFCVNGEIKTYWMGYKLREHPIRFGTGTFTMSTYIQECLDHSKVLLKELNYTGVCEVEYLKDPRTDEYKLIEINARTWLWVGHAKHCGVDFASIVYNYYNNIENNYPQTYTIGVKWIHILTDYVYNTIGVLKGKYKLSELFKSLKGEMAYAVYNQDDLKPIVFEMTTFPFIFAKRIMNFEKINFSLANLYHNFTYRLEKGLHITVPQEDNI